MSHDAQERVARQQLRDELVDNVGQNALSLMEEVIERLGLMVVPGRAATDSGETERLRRQLNDPETKLPVLLRFWQQRDPELAEWKHVEPYRVLAKRLIDLGVPFMAREVAEAGLTFASGEERLRLKHLTGLALARAGAVEEASRVLCDKELAELPRDEEIRGLEAALQKRLGLMSHTPEESQKHLRWALALYRAAWKAKDGTFWTGINVASLYLLLGERDQAAETARGIERDCLEEERSLGGDAHDDPYWRRATLGEACLCQGRISDAESWYRKAFSAANGRVGHLNSSRRQLRYLLPAAGEPVELVDQWLPVPRVAVFVGHSIDDPGRQPPRFPAHLEEQVKATIADWLATENVRVGISSAASGADILFLEALQSLDGSDTRIVLPYAESEFIEESVKNGADDSWVPRFHQVLKKASQVTIASTDRVGEAGEPYEYANRIVLGQGRMRTDELQTSLLGLAVWNGEPGDGPGGTADTVLRWLRQDLTVFSIGLSDDGAESSDSQLLPVRCEGPDCPIEVVPSKTAAVKTPLMSMLFADTVGFSNLPDREVELFVEKFLGQVARHVEKHAGAIAETPAAWCHSPIPVRETWGDGLYFTFRDVRSAGLFALDLCDDVRTTKWREELGFSNDFEIRIALHAGPVHLGSDPVTGLPKCTGAHVSRAARLEPKTPPNQVYASDAFASLAAEQQVSEFVCEFVKLLEWHKHYGTYPTYAVRRQPSGTAS